MRPIGLKVGPVITLATNPYTRKSNSHGSPVRIVANAKANTMPATDLAATSFTGLGKLRIDFMELWLIVNYLPLTINHHIATLLEIPGILPQQPQRLIRKVLQWPVGDTVGYV